jgi:DNA-directed RNA polymerase specialized sigma24 family protein
MTRNKLASAARKQYQHRRDTRRTEPADDALDDIAVEDSPSEKVANEELLQALREQLTLEERQLAQLRAEGLSWDEIALRLGGKAQARRMQLTRGIERAGKKLGLHELYE